MELNIQKEEMSLAYIHAVAARAGYDYSGRVRRDAASADGEISSDEGLFPSFKYQAKSTSASLVDGDEVVYDLEVKNYNDLCVESREARLLILVEIPEDVSAWTTVSIKTLCIHCTGYWHSLRGRDHSSNASTQRIRFPESQRFDPDQLTVLMSRVEDGEL